MTLKKKILIALLIIVSVPALFVVVNIADNYRKSIAAESKIKNARQTAEIVSDEKIKEATNILKELGIATDSLGSSKTDVCYVNHRDQGWFAASWYQDCYIRYVDGFTTKLSRDEVMQRLTSNIKTPAYFGQSYSVSVNRGVSNCGLFEEEYKTTLLYRPANYRLDHYSCEIPNPLQALWSVKGPIVSDDELSVKAYRTFDIDEVDNSKNQVWIMFDDHYYHEDLGCGVGAVFCNNPRSKPVHPSI